MTGALVADPFVWADNENGSNKIAVASVKICLVNFML
jgi:hypothetical protein